MDKGSSSRIIAHHTTGNEHSNQSNSGGYNAIHRMEFPLFNGEDARVWKMYEVFSNDTYTQGSKGAFSLDSHGDRFEDSDHERVVSGFNKLHQGITVNAYLERFEELEAQMLTFNKNLGEEFFMMKFISGLKEKIKGHVATMKLTTLTQAIVFARKHETTVNAILNKT
ncbi:UNVERIFIED_CONTAM: hypothetical protein Sangu_2152800 [Sesamum angustifolium]|uniref:Retrotransposon gag domain-containing protein n=1 Tax=Sesamum angustifolium TaxID=2727405 RepID=A0AAW2LDK7_9LAMI